jgi:hypothetical protein
MLSLVTKKRSTAFARRIRSPSVNWRVFSTRQVRLPTRRQKLRRNAAKTLNLRAIIIFSGCYSRGTMKNFKDLGEHPVPAPGPSLVAANLRLEITTSTQISLSCRAFWSSGGNLSKVSCIRSPLRIPASSNRSRSKQWTAFSGFIDQRPVSLTRTGQIGFVGFFDAPIERKLHSDALVN